MAAAARMPYGSSHGLPTVVRLRATYNVQRVLLTHTGLWAARRQLGQRPARLTSGLSFGRFTAVKLSNH